MSFSVTFSEITAPGQFITATATDPDGNTAEFPQCRLVTAAPSALEAPRNLRARRIRQLVLLQWEGADDATTFRIFQRLNGEADFTAIGQTTERMFNDTLPPGTTTAAAYFVAAEDAVVLENNNEHLKRPSEWPLTLPPGFGHENCVDLS